MRLRSLATRLGQFAAAGVLLALAATPAAAQHAGARVGVSSDPDQFYFGGHVETGPVADKLTFRPNVEIGVGNGMTVTALNFEFKYPLIARRDWEFYGAGGPALNIVRISGADTGSNGGFNIAVGAAHKQGLFVEAKIGLADSPQFKFGVGYQFR